MPSHYWGNYNLIFGLRKGAKFEKYPLFDGESFNAEGLKSAIERCGEKAIISFNSPNNPTGYSYTESDVEKITEVVLNAAENGKKIVAICDDAYFGLFYEDGIFKESLFTKFADLHENILGIRVFGPTKEDYVWGLRVGALVFGIKNGDKELYDALESKAAGLIRGTISNASHLSQRILSDAYKSPEYGESKRKNDEKLKERYNTTKEVLKNKKFSEVFTPYPFNSGYFMCIRLRDGLDANEVRKLLLEKYNTGVISMGKNDIRIAFSSIPTADIPTIFENIYKACKELI